MPLYVTILQILAVPVLIALNAFFVAAEYAVVAIRASKIEEMRQNGIKGAAVLGRLKQGIGDSLAAIQICITATNLLIGAVSEPMMTRGVIWALSPFDFGLPPAVARMVGLAIGLTIVTFFTVVLSELLPKALTLQFTEQIALRVARPIEFVKWLCAPLIKLMNWSANRITLAAGLGRLNLKEPALSEAELEIMVDQADDAGEFHEQHGELLRRAFDFADLKVRHVMIPLRNAGVIDSNASVDDLAAQLGEKPFTRWPLRDPATGRINGVVNVKMALFANAVAAGDAVILHDLAVPPTTLDPDLPLVDALHLLRQKRVHIAVVVDKKQGEMGVVTLEDILASIVGKISSDAKTNVTRRREY
ncbi:MAG: HlyC/CorC family transporter [Planctomycetes bacterium]|nr:HlyC/CorC family transporter [Planctomycetota bacterium]